MSRVNTDRGTPELMNISPIQADDPTPTQSKEVTPEGFTVSPISVHTDTIDIDFRHLDASLTPKSVRNEASLVGDSPNRKDQLQYRDWLKAQVLQHKAELMILKNPEEYNLFDSLSAEELNDIMQHLKKELTTVSSVHSCRNKVMKSLYFTKTIEEILYADDPLASGEDTEKKRHLEELMDKSCQTVTELGHVQKDLEKLRQELVTIKKRNFELMKKSRQLYSELQAGKETKENSLANLSQDRESKRLSDQYRTTVQKNTILRETLQGLIFGSGINWMQDEKAAKLVELLGKNVD